MSSNKAFEESDLEPFPKDGTEALHDVGPLTSAFQKLFEESGEIQVISYNYENELGQHRMSIQYQRKTLYFKQVIEIKLQILQILALFEKGINQFMLKLQDDVKICIRFVVLDNEHGWCLKNTKDKPIVFVICYRPHIPTNRIDFIRSISKIFSDVTSRIPCTDKCMKLWDDILKENGEKISEELKNKILSRAGASDVTEVFVSYLTPLDISADMHITGICALCESPGRFSCSKCKEVRYCNRKCQKAAWKRGHREECAELLAGREGEKLGETGGTDASGKQRLSEEAAITKQDSGNQKQNPTQGDGNKKCPVLLTSDLTQWLRPAPVPPSEERVPLQRAFFKAFVNDEITIQTGNILFGQDLGNVMYGHDFGKKQRMVKDVFQKIGTHVDDGMRRVLIGCSQEDEAIVMYISSYKGCTEWSKKCEPKKPILFLRCAHHNLEQDKPNVSYRAIAKAYLRMMSDEEYGYIVCKDPEVMRLIAHLLKEHARQLSAALRQEVEAGMDAGVLDIPGSFTSFLTPLEKLLDRRSADECCVCGASGTAVCTQCKGARYCSKACQKEDWKQGHKLVCF